MRERALAVVAVAVCGIGVVAAAGRSGADGGDAAVVVAPTTSTTATTVPEATAVVVTASSSSPPDLPPPSTSTTVVPAPTTTTTVAAPALVAPHVGAYRERYTGPAGGGEGTLAVTRRGTTTTLRRRVDDSISSQSLRYGEDGIVLLATDDGGGPCRFDAPPLQLPAAVEVGSQWHSDATCTTADGISVDRVEDAVVTGEARTTVDGVVLDTWIVQRHVVETSTGDGVVVVGETASSELFAPAVGMAVYRIARADLPDPDGTIVSTAVSIELLSITSG